MSSYFLRFVKSLKKMLPSEYTSMRMKHKNVRFWKKETKYCIDRFASYRQSSLLLGYNFHGSFLLVPYSAMALLILLCQCT